MTITAHGISNSGEHRTLADVVRTCELLLQLTGAATTGNADVVKGEGNP